MSELERWFWIIIFHASMVIIACIVVSGSKGNYTGVITGIFCLVANITIIRLGIDWSRQSKKAAKKKNEKTI